VAKPSVNQPLDRGEQAAGFGAAALVAAASGKARGGAQFPELCPLLRGIVATSLLTDYTNKDIRQKSGGARGEATEYRSQPFHSAVLSGI
jgi:hypothetical protein